MNFLYEYLAYFFIYGFIGWCLEVCYHAIETGKWANRGFLNGAICPIYGIGVVVIFLILEPISNFGPLLFAGAVFVCTAIELITAVALEKIFHQRWWDYSKEHLNYKGYICLKFSLYWGLGAVFIVKLVHPSIERFVVWFPTTVGTVFLIIASAILVVDALDTFRTIIGINRELQTIHEAAATIRKVSDGLSERIYEGAIRVKEEKEEMGEKLVNGREELELQMALGRAELETRAEELKERAEETGRKLRRGQQRLLRAFPDMRSTRYETDMETVREILEKYRSLRRRK